MMQELKIKEKYFKTKYDSHKNKFKRKLVHRMKDELKENLTWFTLKAITIPVSLILFYFIL